MHLRNILPLAAALSLASCAQIASSLDQPLSSEYSPLDGPSVNYDRRGVQQTGPNFTPGEWVETVMPNGTFFNRIPRGSAAADQVLSLGTPMKVISTKGSYLKVELEDSSVGYMPTIMVAKPSTSNDTSPFLPPPPTAPLQRTSPTIPENSTSVPLSSGSDSLIPAPSGTLSQPLPSALQPQSRKPSEILIPTTASPSLVEPELVPGEGVIPAPAGNLGFE